MESLQNLAATCIRDDTAPYLDSLHELPVPVLQQLLSALSPSQLLTLESRLDRAVDTAAVWKKLCEKLRYSSKRREPWEAPHSHPQCYFRNQFLKHYISAYLLPFLVRWPQNDPDLRPTEKVFRTQCNHLYNVTARHKEGVFLPMTLESFLEHLATVAAYAVEISMRAVTLQHVMSHPSLVTSLLSNLQVLRVLSLTDDAVPSLLQFLEQLVSRGKLLALHLVNAKLNAANLHRLLRLCCGAFFCPLCSPATTLASISPTSKHTKSASTEAHIHSCPNNTVPNTEMGTQCGACARGNKEELCCSPDEERFKQTCEFASCSSSGYKEVFHEQDKQKDSMKEREGGGCPMSNKETSLTGENSCQSVQQCALCRCDCHDSDQQQPEQIVSTEENDIWSFLYMQSIHCKINQDGESVCRTNEANRSSDTFSGTSRDRHSAACCSHLSGFADEEIRFSGKMKYTSAESGEVGDLDLFDEAILSTSSLAESRAEDFGVEPPSADHGSHRCSQNCTPVSCAHGIESISLQLCNFFNEHAFPFLPVLTRWLPSWGALKHLVIHICEDYGVDMARKVLVDKIRTGQLTHFILSMDDNCIKGHQLVWDVLQVLASPHSSSSCTDPMEQFAFSVNSSLTKGQLYVPDTVVTGVHSLCFWDTVLEDVTTVRDLTQYISRDLSLRYLSLKGCRISSFHLAAILSELNRCRSSAHNGLEMLELEGVDLSQGWTTLCALVGSSHKLTTLTLTGCFLTAEEVLAEDFVASLKALQHLSYLDLSYNSLYDCLVQFVPAIVFPGCPLKTLNIGNTRMDFSALQHLTDALLSASTDADLPLLDSLTVPGLHWATHPSQQSQLLLKLRRISACVDCEGDDHVSDYVAQM